MGLVYLPTFGDPQKTNHIGFVGIWDQPPVSVSGAQTRSLKEDQEALRREVLEALSGGTSSRGGAVLRVECRLFPGEDAFPVENDGGKLALKEMAIMFYGLVG